MKRIIPAVLLFAVLAAHAGQTAIPNYEAARDQYFWTLLYSFGGSSIYCNQPFQAGEKLTVEHAYPADWIAEAMGCDNRECDKPEYGFAEADLHNLWPALGNINTSRGDLRLAEIPDDPDQRRFIDVCEDFERSAGSDAAVEPRDEVKGDLARSILYMAIEYDLPLKGMGPTLMKWHQEDPPDDTERWRNYVIEQLQGNSNPFIESL